MTKLTAVPKLTPWPWFEDAAIVPCTSHQPCDSAATWVGTMGDCRHTFTICDSHKLRVDCRSIVVQTNWFHRDCTVGNSHITWRRL